MAGPRGTFVPIADYGFLSDCETTALVAPGGGVEWMCLPRMDSPSIFGALLDRSAGTFRVGPSEVEVPAARRYVPGTMVLETSWWTQGGWLVVRDALLMGPWHHEDNRSKAHRRAPTDYDAEHILLRTVQCVNGESQVRMDCLPVFDYGRAPARWEYSGPGYHEAQATSPDGEVTLQLTSDLNIGFEGPLATGRTLLRKGDCRFVALSWSDHRPLSGYAEAYDRLLWTLHHWQHWLDRGSFPDHPWQNFLQRSALTLKGLTYAPTGAIAAAATTSLPEAPGGPRNWDYRYTWIRDTTLTLTALYRLGYDWEANDFFYFLADLAENSDGRVQLMYGVDGSVRLDEELLDHMAGYEGAVPVRVGNDAYRQRQHDVWGAIVGSIYLFVRKRDRLDDRLWPIVIAQVEAALAHWREPDHGPWEVRAEPRHFTYSKAVCWLAAERGARLARIRGDEARVAEWGQAAAEIHADILEHGVDGRGVLTQHYETTALDASVLGILLQGFLPADDPRVRHTVLAIADELTEEDLVLRYRVGEAADGLAGEGTSFTMCSFWLVSALVMIGEIDRACALCEKLLSLAGPLQLYGQDLDPHTGRHLGNYPQAFAHLALVNALTDLIHAESGLRAASQDPMDPAHPRP